MVAPRARSPSAKPGRGAAAYSVTSRSATYKSGASTGFCSRLSTTTSCGWRGAWDQPHVQAGSVLQHGSHAGQYRAGSARQAWPSVRASVEVIHWLWPLGRAVVPSSEAATFMRTQEL